MFGNALAFRERLLYNLDMTFPRRVIVEFINIGNALKVVAVCEDTGKEVSMVGDPRASKAELERLAINKLRFVMRKEAEKKQTNTRGIVV